MPASVNAHRKPIWWLALMLVVATAAATVYAWPPKDPAVPANKQRHTQTPNRATTTAKSATTTPNSTTERTLARDPVRTNLPDSDANPQGFRGLVVDSSSRPLGGVTVYLIESASNDPLLFPLAQQHRHLLAPIASAQTDVDGTFAVGLAIAQQKIYDLFLTSTGHATVRMTGLRLLASTWHNLGTLTLQDGATIKGRVSVEGQQDLPIPQAVITVTTGGAFADAAMRALPGGEGALITHTDINGEYELPHAPATGVVRVSAIAQGFARVINQEVELNTQHPVRVDFELPPGKTLAGDILTTTGLAIANARVEAWSHEASARALISHSDDNGRFVLHGLHAGPYRVRATAKGFSQQEQVAAEPGQHVHLTLAKKNFLQVVVRTPNGRLLRNYRLGLRRFFPADLSAALDDKALRQGSIGSVHEVFDQRIRLNSNEDHAEIHGVPGGVFTCEVDAEGFAKTLSTPFRFSQAGDQVRDVAHPDGHVQRIDVVVSTGCNLRGRVLNHLGAPLANATVTTQPAGTMPDSPILRMMQGWSPQKITAKTKQTDENGYFALQRLGLATYQLMIEHADACRTIVREVDCNHLGKNTLRDIVMAEGSIVTGTATALGRTAGQMKVILTTPPAIPADKSIRLETVTDGEGRYRFIRRIPPGNYELRTATVGSTEPNSEIFQQLLQLKRSSITLIVPTGQDVVHHDLTLPSDN